MNKKYITITLSIIVLAFIISGCTNSADTPATKNGEDLMSKAPAAEKIEVVHFHGTQQCWSCKTVGEYALKTIEDKFSDEYRNNIIVFKDINADLEENSEIVAKYQARGSSLFINVIINGQDNIAEDTKVWRLVSDEVKYIDYFGNKLNGYLDK
ncbi:hypothetical protein KKF61_00335 [Patescibacteria group bacterium]|nr:hypothetical protein [Patescibacteria group bacterium]MBU0964207.1 hypothetical protein [Patescibacteria group bacterium]